ncbi:hypothetical protein HAHE_08090 [Haloferula helveola]|uniref:Planctomycete cytochrome C n=1 Tax=Haloferula helveola TaxID=490095 RepID=A0ABM7RBA4_9BACT|nr:hypothetical protein HAHE_08090 [Haloferula helveola]
MIALLAATATLQAEPLRSFFEQHCIACHGPDETEGDLRLDTLPPLDGADDETREHWLTVLEVLEDGDMPPKKEPQPEAVEVAKVTGHIAAGLARLEEGPPPALRRMNRHEYENTLHDLLGIDTPLAEMLPEDGKVMGFDNVADGLSISPVLMERYLEAADVAFDAVIRRFPPLPSSTRRSVLMERKENRDSVDRKKGGSIESHGAFVDFSPGWPPARVDEVNATEPGRYDCRLAVWPHQPGERLIAVEVFVGPLFGTGKRRFVGVFDVTGKPGQPRVIEFSTWMDTGDSFHVLPRIFPEHVTWRDKHEERPGLAIEWMEVQGPLDQDFPSLSQIRLFGDRPTLSMEPGTPIWMRHRKDVKHHTVVSSQPEEDLRAILLEFIPRALRRPVPEPLAEQFVGLALDRLEAGRSFEESVRAGVTAVLCSPYFLLLNRENEIDDYALASRLSYFLWSSMPDEELLALAAEARLSDPAVRRAQVERMLADPKRERFVESFTGQWLDLREIEFTTPDPKLYPEFDPLLQHAMLGETRGFFREVLDRDLAADVFLDSDFTVLNRRLAEHYGLEGPDSHERFEVTALPADSIRGGLLTQGSVLKVTANGTTTSPVLRGVWVLEKILGRPAPPPPPGVPAVEPDIRGATSIREQLAKHSHDPSCARCHDRIDPPGFALESFDPVGGVRDRYRTLGEGDKPPGNKKNYRLGLPVDASGETRHGRDFAGFTEFREALLADSDDVARALAEKLLVYATGRAIGPGQRGEVDAILDSTRTGGHGLRSMIHAVVESELFHEP